MSQLTDAFEERLSEIEAYLAFLQLIEDQVRLGPPEIGESATPITPQQQRILYSGIYLQFYNLIEATAHWCVDAVTDAATNDGTIKPSDLCDELRREWVRTTARTHVELNYDNRLLGALELCRQLVDASPVAGFRIARGANWDDVEIETLSRRLGLQLQISPDVYRGAKQPVRDNLGPLSLVRDLRNRLAHGAISFTECSEGVTVEDLRRLKSQTEAYLREVVEAFEAYIDAREFLRPSSQPSGAK